jgi:predicted transcriptional regulator
MTRRAKTSPERAPLNPIRRKLIELIQERPGARLLDLWQEMRSHRGTAHYHLEILERVGAVQSFHRDGATRYFPGSYSPLEARQMTLLMRGYVLEVVREILEHPGIAQEDILHTVDISRKVFRAYADALKHEGLLEERRDGRAKRYSATPELSRLYERLKPPTGPSAAGPAQGADRHA